jgi:hypothetical protein
MPSTVNRFWGSLVPSHKHISLVYGFAPLERLLTSKVSCTFPSTRNDWRLWFPRRTDSILSLCKFLAQIGSRLVASFTHTQRVWIFVLRLPILLFVNPSVVSIPRTINSAIAPIRVQFGKRNFKVFADCENLACLETHCPARVVIYGNLDQIYWDVPPYIPSLINNVKGIAGKRKEIQVPQLRHICPLLFFICLDQLLKVPMLRAS